MPGEARLQTGLENNDSQSVRGDRCHLTGQVGKASLPRKGAKGAKERNQPWKMFVETHLFVSFNAHNRNSHCVYFAASQKTFTSPSSDLNSGSPVRSAAFLILASAAAKQSA